MFYVLRVDVYCHRVSTQLQLTNMYIKKYTNMHCLKVVLVYDTCTSEAQCEFWKFILFGVDGFQRGVSITSFKEKLIYNLKATLKIINTKKKNCKILILPQGEYPMPYRLQFCKEINIMYNLTVRGLIILSVHFYAFLITVKNLSEKRGSCDTFYKCVWTVFL
jgi:hypothetical protein